MNASANTGRAFADFETYQLGLYSAKYWNDFHLSFGLSSSLHDIYTSRNVKYIDLNDHDDASLTGISHQAFTELGYTFNSSIVDVTPFVGVSYARVDLMGFEERQTRSALIGESGHAHVMSTLLGLRVHENFKLSDESRISYHAMAAWQSNSQGRPSATLHFAGGEAFTISGVPVEKNALLLQGGVQYTVADHLSLGLSYEGRMDRKIRDHSMKMELKLRF
ncbi:autotransporter domain-containing protein [Daeguia caeni]|uniref:Autotransporter domain-containing protein n=1 Tax=Daeguia caeni TaxID=439612 RepID=A0ABV9H7S1_9HYPH